MVFAGYSGFLHYLQMASHELTTIGIINVTKNEIQIQIQAKGAYANQARSLYPYIAWDWLNCLDGGVVIRPQCCLSWEYVLVLLLSC